MTDIVASSAPMREAVRLAERVARTDANVLITGESGAGKDQLARFIHAHSQRASQSFIKIDCGALPGELLEAELFGYERGAFTGATEARPGRLEAAHKGTLVLDEVAHLGWDAQAKLLRVIERREFERLGGRRTVRVDARLIALTNVDLDMAVKRKAFREDLFYRLNVVRIHVSPLRERREDIKELVVQFLKTYAEKHGSRARTLSKEAANLLEAYEWPGNVRELANTIERAVIVADGERLEESHLPEPLRAAVAADGHKQATRTLAEVEADHILRTLRASGGNKSEAARLLGISRKNLYEKLARYEKGKKDKRGNGEKEDEL